MVRRCRASRRGGAPARPFAASYSEGMHRPVTLSARLLLPAVWIGLIIAIDLIEAPLKFQAPGITIPLGLGIGRLVFTAMNIVEVVIAILLAIAVFRRPRPSRASFVVGGVIALCLIVKTAVVRPLLAVHTDAVLTGTSNGGSMTHYGYIAVDAVIFIALIVFVILQVRGLRFEVVEPGARGHLGGRAETPEAANSIPDARSGARGNANVGGPA